ncbi:MAG: phage holin family protein [Betaproteobacteria bacterium]|nr:phage holin family protein [Betaproteobacteria bacterium]
MGYLLLRWLLSALALLAVAYLYPGVRVETFFAAVIAALALGLANALIRPILVVLTLPVTIVTLGLFLFVINAALFWLVAQIVKGFHVQGFLDALVGSILYSLITLVVSWIVSGSRKPGPRR